MLRDEIKKEIQKAVPEGIEFSVEQSDREEHGDYSTNAAMAAAKQMNESPTALSGRIKEKLSESSLFSRVEAVPPGFINLWISDGILSEEFKKLIKSKGALKLNLGKGKKLQVEPLSANPTGPLHVGHGRMAFYGDALSNILSAVGYKVTREYYINDSRESRQIKELGKTVMGEGDAYKGEYLDEVIKKLGRKFKNESDAGFAAANLIQKENKSFIQKALGIKFDTWVSEEKDLREKSYFKKAQKAVTKFTYEKDGAVWLKTSEFGDDEDRVVVRSDGTPTYFLADIAYFTRKDREGYDTLIHIWGADHQGHVKRILAAKEMLKWKGNFKILVSQLVALKGGERMSKRAGTVVWLKDLVDEVGLDVARWFFLEKSLNTHMEFDLDLARQESQKNPVYYVQYAGARMSSILRKARHSNSQFSISNFQSAERSLIKKLLEVYEVLEDTAGDYQVHRLTTYAYELAYTFSIFYRDVKVLGSGEDESWRLLLVKTTRQVLKNVLDLLGIDSPDRM